MSLVRFGGTSSEVRSRTFANDERRWTCPVIPKLVITGPRRSTVWQLRLMVSNGLAAAVLSCCVLVIAGSTNEPLVCLEGARAQRIASLNMRLFSSMEAPSTIHPLARDPPRVLIGWPLPLGFGLDGRLLLARRVRVYV